MNRPEPATNTGADVSEDSHDTLSNYAGGLTVETLLQDPQYIAVVKPART